MNFSKLFHLFIDQGKRPSSSQETTALLDEARSTILDISRRAATGEIKLASGTELLEPKVAANSVKLKSGVIVNPDSNFGKAAIAAANPAPLASPYPAPAAPKQVKPAKPLPSPASDTAQPAEKFVTANEFIESRPVRVMKMGEFKKFSASDRNEWIRSGGKLRD